MRLVLVLTGLGFLCVFYTLFHTLSPQDFQLLGAMFKISSCVSFFLLGTLCLMEATKRGK